MRKILHIALIFAMLALSSCSFFEDIAADFSSAETAANASATRNPASPPSSDALTAVFIDVNQGDSALVMCGGKVMLIDAGEKRHVGNVIDALNTRGISRIDILVGTHPHSDHIGGLQDVVERFDIGQVYMPDVQTNTRTFENLLDAIIDKGLDIIAPKPGETLAFGGAEITFLGPITVDERDLNGASIVLKVTYDGYGILFTGDAERKSEEDILAAGGNVSAHVLKVGHHGSSTSTSQSFLNAVNPHVAVISLGADNTYGHPHKETMERLSASNASDSIYRTDLHGNIIVIIDGGMLSVTTSTNETGGAAVTEPGSIEISITYIGNANSLRFHLETCASLPAEHNRVIFDTRAKAVEANYQPCGNCEP